MQLGFRSGMNTLGANLNALVGQTGDALGLKDFAADRFKDAAEYTAAADKPGIKDWGEVKDFTTLTHFVGRLIGQAAPQMAPAIGLSVGLRSPMRGSMLGFGVPGAGQQVQNLRADPKVMQNNTSGEILANAAAKGTAEGALFGMGGAPANMMRRATGTIAKEAGAKSLGEAALKDAAAQGAILPAADLVGQVAHQQLNPEKQIDTSHMLEEAITGGALGAVGGAAGHAIGALPRAAESVGQLKERFKKGDKPADAETDMPPDSIQTPEEITAWLKAQEKSARDYAASKWDTVKDSGLWDSMEEFMKDPSVLKQSAKDLKADHYDQKVKPVVDGVLGYGKDIVKRLNDKRTANGEPAPKKSEMRGKDDNQILQTIASALPDEFKNEIPADKLMEVSDVFRKLAENPDELAAGIPRELARIMGGHENLATVMESVHEILGEKMPKEAKRVFQEHKKMADSQLDSVKKVINAYGRPDHLTKPENMKVLENEGAKWLLDQLHSGDVDPKYKEKFDAMFDPQHHAKAAAALEKIRVEPTTVDKAFTAADRGHGPDAEAHAEGVKDVRETENPAPEDTRKQVEPHADKRLDQTFPDTPEGRDKSRALINELELEHGRKNVRVRAYLNEAEQIAHHMEPADTTGLTPQMLRNSREDPKQNKSKLVEGVISVVTDEHPSGVKINLHRLTAEMMRTEPPAGRPGTELDYVRDMFARGMSALMNTGEIRGFTKSGKEQLIRKTAAGTWDFPDSTPIIKMHGKQYTYGDIKTYKLSRKDLRGITDDDIKHHDEVVRKEEARRKTQAEENNRAFKPKSEGTIKQEAIDRAVQASQDRAMDQTYLDPRDIPKKEEIANDSKPTEKSRDPKTARTYEEDLGGAATSIGEASAPKIKGPKVAETGAGGDFVELPNQKVEQGMPVKTVTETKSTADKLVEQLAKDTQEANRGKPNYRANKDPKFSTMNVGEGPVTPEQRKAVRDYVKKVLGDEASVKFLKKMDGVGEFAKINGEEMIKISAMAADPLSVGHHEAVHAFMARLMDADPKARNTLLRAASAPAITARLRTLLKDHPKALEQLSVSGQMEAAKRDGREMTEAEATANAAEERLAYMYQFAAAGKKGLITIGPETKTWFEKVKSVFRKIAAVWADDFSSAEALDKAGDILSAFHEGRFADRSTVAEVMHDRFPRGAYEATEAMMPWLARVTNKFLWTATGAVRDANIPAMTGIMDKMFTATDSNVAKPGFVQEKHAVYNRFINKVADVFQMMPTEERQKYVRDDLQSGEAPKTREGKAIRKILDEAHDYLVEKNVQLVTKDEKGKLKLEKLNKLDNYFPRVYNQDVLRTPEGKEAFLKLLAEYKIPAEKAIDAYNSVTKYAETGKPGEEDSALGLTYFTPQLAKRTLGFVPDAKLAPFLDKDLFGTLSQYLQRAARRGEYADRFGNIGEEITTAREQAIKEGATPTQLKAFDDSVKAMEGTLGADIDPKLKNIYSGLMTYQNLRLLPLQLFASLVDPLGIMVRGGTLGEAVTAFGKGIRDLATLGKTSKDAAFELAKTVGSIDAANAHGLMSDMAGSAYMPKLQRTINDKFFRYNGMELWNNRMRAQATVAAQNFIDKHINRPNEHSARFMEELGLKKGDKLDVSNPEYLRAVNKWVDEAILRPNSAQRPVYMSDPNWMLISHLKQYTYLFQKVIVARVYHEAQNGNYAPAVALTAYVPGMIAADMLKMGLTPGSGDNNARAGWTAKDWIGHGMQRAGLFGPSQYGLEMGTDMQRGGIGIESAAGPTIQQAIQFAQGASQGRVGTQLEKAIPGYNVIKPAGGNGSK